MALILLKRYAPLRALNGVWSFNPLSAQAQTPSRPSGAGKQKERAQNEGGRRQAIRRGRNGRLFDRANGLARRHVFACTLKIGP